MKLMTSQSYINFYLYSHFPYIFFSTESKYIAPIKLFPDEINTYY